MLCFDECRPTSEISTLTLCVSHDVLLKLKERIREFRRELLHVAEQEDYEPFDRDMCFSECSEDGDCELAIEACRGGICQPRETF